MTTRRKLLGAGLMFVLVGLAVNAFRLAVPAVRAAQSTAIPYTVLLQETVTDSAGIKTPAPVQLWAQRSDGTTIQRMGPETTGGRVIHFASGIEVWVAPVLQRKSSMRAPRIDLANLADPASGCVRTFNGLPVGNPPVVVEGEERLMGYRAFKLRLNSSILKWVAADFGCATIRQRVDLGKDGLSELELLTLIPGEPAEAILTVPANFEEGPPSRLNVPVSASKCDARCQDRFHQRMASLDESYEKRRLRDR